MLWLFVISLLVGYYPVVTSLLAESIICGSAFNLKSTFIMYIPGSSIKKGTSKTSLWYSSGINISIKLSASGNAPTKLPSLVIVTSNLGSMLIWPRFLTLISISEMDPNPTSPSCVQSVLTVVISIVP